MPARVNAEALLRGILALGDLSLRVAWLREALRGSTTTALAEALDVVCARGEQGEPAAREVLSTVVQALATTDDETREAVQRLREESAGGGLLALERLLRAPPPAPSLGSSLAPKAAIPDYGKGRPLTLGERKSLARGQDREMLARLLLDPHPDVIHRLLANPRLTEDDVVRLASKRPCRPDVLAEIARSDRWAQRGRVRVALVINPSTPTALAAPMVSLLMRQELRFVASVTAVPPLLRALCLEHLGHRPPVPFGEDGDAPIQ